MLDIFFEALNYETIEQKKAYEVAGLLGEWLCPAPCPTLASSNVVPRAVSPAPRHRGVPTAWAQSRAPQRVTAVMSSALSLLHLPPDSGFMPR